MSNNDGGQLHTYAVVGGQLNKAVSLYLDLLRVSAALSVLLYHASWDQFGGRWLFPVFGHAGALGVTAFFVLSGFVICYVTETKETVFRIYLINRLARLWSVVIPALMLTIVADWIGRAYNASIYPEWYPSTIGVAIAKLTAAALFFSQVWFIGASPLSNEPFWSLSYEFFYYLAFGVFALLPGFTGKLLSGVVLVIAGPKILLLMPAWLMGVFVYRNLLLAERLPLSLAALFFISPAAFYPLAAADLVPELPAALKELLGERGIVHSRIFGTAMTFGALIALNILGSVRLAPAASEIIFKLEKPVRHSASATLSIYLYHYPLLLMFAALLNPGPTSWLTNISILLLTLAIIGVLAPLTEGKKAWVRAALWQIDGYISRAVHSFRGLGLPGHWR